MKLYEIKYSLNILPPLRIGSGIVIGNLNLAKEPSTPYYIPGNTLRGLIGYQLLKLKCKKLSTGEKPNCDHCKEDCEYKILIHDKNHGRGAYFHFGKINNDEVEIVSIPMSQLTRDSKTVVKGISPFFYQALYPRNEKKITINATVYLVNNNDKELLDTLKHAILTTKHQCLGGRRSWGWGYIIDVKVLNIKEINIETHEENFFINSNLKLLTPLPIEKGKTIEETIKNSIRHLLSMITPEKTSMPKDITIRIRSPFRIKPINYWNESENKPYTEPALSEETIINIKGNKLPKTLLEYIKIFGLTINGTWYTKAGYGIAIPLNTNNSEPPKKNPNFP